MMAEELTTHPSEVNLTVTPSNTTDDYEGFYEMSQFVTGVILYPIVISCGLIGNSLTLAVLSDPRMRTSTNAFLSALAVADILKLLNDTLYFIVSILFIHHKTAANNMLGYMYPFSHYVLNQAICVSAWLTVSVAVERYVSVCHASKARVVCTVRRARIISAVVFVLMSLISVPAGLRYQRKLKTNPLTNTTEFEIGLSELGQNESFMPVYTWILNLLRSIIPLCVLIVLNGLIIHSLRQERVPGKKMSSRNRITMMLIVVIIVFIVCIFPDAIMSTVFNFGYVDESSLVKGIREFTDLLVAINSAVNFGIYCVCSRCFREVFADKFCHRGRGRRGSRQGRTTMYEMVNGRTHRRSKAAVDGPTQPSSSPNACHTEATTAPGDDNAPLNGGQEITVYLGPQTYL